MKETLKIVETAGYVPTNLSISVQAEHPKLAPYIDKMTENISKACGIERTNCAVTAGTCEGLGFVGEGLGIAAYCAVLLKEV